MGMFSKEEKRKIYPIGCSLASDGRTMNANIMKLTQRGMLVDSLTQSMKVHDCFQVNFVLPLNGKSVSCEAVVVKTYDQFRGKHGLEQAANHVNELVFKNPPQEVRIVITEFLKDINSTIF